MPSISATRILHSLTPNSRINIILRRPTIRAHLPRLVHNLLQILLRQPAYLDEQLDAQSHVEVFHAADEFDGGFDDRVFGGGGHFDAKGGGDGVHGGLD